MLLEEVLGVLEVYQGGLGLSSGFTGKRTYNGF